MVTRDHSAIRAVAATLGIDIPEAYRDSIVENYERLLEQAALIMAFPALYDDSEPSDFLP